MSAHLTRGVNCATLTPLDDSYEPHLDLLAEHCRWLLGAGCDGIVLLGTTGEATSFTASERKAILEGVLERGIAADRLIVGTGCCAVADTAALSAHALACGVARILMLPPFYYKNLEEAGVVTAFARTIEAVGDERLRVYLYQIPQLTGVSLGATVIDALIEAYPSTIAGIKDSSGDWSGISRLCGRFGTRIDVLVGSERYLVPALRAGASGCVTATANAHPAMICELYRGAAAAGADAFQEKVAAARAVFEEYPMIAALKEFTARRTGDAHWRNLRPPLAPLDGAHAQRLAREAQLSERP
jgi:4-hydroxy-tetrahydrodipicolinate synthase